VALARLADARALLRARRYDGAYYLAGYVVECALKACIARQFKAATIPERGSVDKLYVHDLRLLARYANLEAAIGSEAHTDRQFGTYWLTVQEWHEQSRYQLGRRAIEAQNLVEAVANAQHGVLRWLTQHW
jgi:HEPN domain-containing protein